MDVLPTLPNPNDPARGILLGDRDLPRWQESNPIAFATWFYKQEEQQLLARRTALTSELRWTSRTSKRGR